MPDTVQPTEPTEAAESKPTRKRSRLSKASEKAGAATQPTEPKPKKPSIFQDRTVRIMGFAAAGLVLLYLAVIVSALLMGVIANDQPQTMVDRDLTTFRTAVEGGSTLESDWAGYARALIDMRQYAPAQDILTQAVEIGIVDVRVRALELQQARLYLLTEQYESAVESADAAIKALDKQLKDDQEDVLAGASPTPLTADGLPETYYGMMLIKVEAHEKLANDAEALKVLTAYIEQRPTASDVLIWRGDVNARLGNIEEARADYESGLRFIADADEKQVVQDKINELGSN